MSAKMEVRNKSDWDDGDDEWDDWGDAEESLPEEAPPAEIDNKITNINKTKLEYDAALNENTAATARLECNNFKVNSEKMADKQQSAGWGSIFGGVVSSVLNTATELTTTVSHGLDKVIGVPDPEELARINTTEAKNLEDIQSRLQNEINEEKYLTPKSAAPALGLSLVNNVTSLGSKVLYTGLDTLEGIGKKTMNILQENDPLLKNKIKKLALEQDKPNLSAILKEAKEENEQMEQSLKELGIEKSNAQLKFDLLFENNCGLVHLEALEILSKESQLKIQGLKESVSGKALEEIIETINEVKELTELEDLEGEPENEDYSPEELNKNLMQAIEDTELIIQFEEISNLWSSCLEWLTADNTNEYNAQTLFAKGISCLAEVTALEVMKLHKIAELLLIKEHHSTANEVDGVVQLCKQFNMHIQVVTNLYATQLSKLKDEKEAKTYINTLFAEMLQARQQIEKAFQLFLPILQIGAI